MTRKLTYWAMIAMFIVTAALAYNGYVGSAMIAFICAGRLCVWWADQDANKVRDRISEKWLDNDRTSK